MIFKGSIKESRKLRLNNEKANLFHVQRTATKVLAILKDNVGFMREYKSDSLRAKGLADDFFTVTIVKTQQLSDNTAKGVRVTKQSGLSMRAQY